MPPTPSRPPSPPEPSLPTPSLPAPSPARTVRETYDRRAGRVVLVDAADAVLLMSGRDPGDQKAPTFWIVPGGGAEDGETEEDAARREVHEETGAALGDLGPVVWRRTANFAFDGCWYNQRESFFVVRVPRFVPQPTRLTDLEQRSWLGTRWWSLPEMANATEPLYPIGLASHIEAWLVSGPPTSPLVID